ncbi:MAG: 5'-nucleotidase C-terminal domain-containing protein, partial [Bacillus sp. (in: firmicutes)]
IVNKTAEVASTFKDGITPDTKIKEELDKYQADIAPITGEVVGEATEPISRTANESGETALGNLIADSMKVATDTDFAFMNVGGIRDEIKDAGPITWGELFAIQPFGNDIVTMNITGEQVRTLLNQQFAADRNRIMQISGLKYTWTNNLPLGQKVLDIYLPNGSKIDPNGVYSVAVNNFMADGGDGFVVLKQGTERTTKMTDLDAFIDYVKSFTGPISAQIEGRILIDKVSPNAPTVNDVTDQSTQITGKTEDSAKVEVKVDGLVIGTAKAKADGTFALTIASLKAGTDVIVTATDAAGNTSAETKVIVKDVTAPNAPVVRQIIAPAKSVTGKAEAGSTVKVFEGKTLLGSVVVDKDGGFTIPFKSAQTHGTVLTFTATDAAGNTSSATVVKLVKSNTKFW